MAKKKTASATKKSPPKKAPKKSPATKAPTAPTSILCAEEIGNTAGEVWSALADRGEQTAAALKKSVNAPADLVMAAIGWLAREEKLNFDSSGRTVKISLR